MSDGTDTTETFNPVADPRFNPAADPRGTVLPLSDSEIEAFLDDLDHNNDGYIDYSEIEAKFDAVNDETQPEAKPHHLHHTSTEDDERHAFLRSIIGCDTGRIKREDMRERVKSWRIPSLKQEKDEEDSQDEYMRKIGFTRRLRAFWAVHGPSIVFLGIVFGMMIAFGVWQLVKYCGEAYRSALGWGVVVAKTCAGILYPTLFFLLLSMARYFSTLLRRSYRVSRFINWDLSQEFHIYMAIWATFLGTLHGIAHLAGDFLWIGNSYRPEPLDNLLGPDRKNLHTYRDLVKSLPGITGIIALFCFFTIGLTSTPWVRKRSYEAFQLGHLLMYPIIACLMAHGTKRILQWPMLGYFLAFPTLLILIERTTRIALGFYDIPATIRILDSETVEIKTTIPGSRIFNYSAGQYLFMQVPELSFFQWHPFTISVCLDKEVQLHIKTDGNWTGRLRKLATNGEKETTIKIGIDGPYGAPAQRFYDFSHTILVGSGVGVTPFSGILADLQARENRLHGGPSGGSQGSSRRGSRRNSVDEKFPRSTSTPPVNSRRNSRKGSADLFRVPSGRSLTFTRSRSRHRNPGPPEFAEDYKRVDFHWIVRDKNHLLWFSDLLNSIGRSQVWHKKHDGLENPHLDIRIQTHVTQARKQISNHVYRWLLELYRTPEHPESRLTGLINPTHFGRPDFVRIFDEYYEDMLRYRTQYGFDRTGDGKNDRFKVGVFFCGSPVVGEMIADRCRTLTARGREDGSRIEFFFCLEVFA
ncbi:Putative respiratory burst oxidase G [Vanrija pseudolonga]|uniref:Respiratory burst oxidase G n=1 Tax=Vanrija pseudolonga TaxID=143232 RepID=A0AAF0YKN0_9TREE|nr:Putative respiratory burst oxidase G [Vanrija pseudolonga]